MAGKPKMSLQSNFPAVKKAAYETVQHARHHALNAGEGEAERRLEMIDDKQDYELPIDIGQENIGFQSGRIYYEPWYGRFFEYGTVHIPATPFMRPANRKMRRVFLVEMGENLEKFIGRRAGIKR